MNPDPYPSEPILLVDDEREWLRHRSLALHRQLGINHVTTCQDSREALPLLANQPAALAILDMTMPHLSGEDTFRKLRNIKPDVRVILMSGYSEQEAGDQLSLGELSGFLQKPFRRTDLARKLRAALI